MGVGLREGRTEETELQWKLKLKPDSGGRGGNAGGLHAWGPVAKQKENNQN